ncbi:MAG: outer membrane lipoprotein carrier protein LolA [Litorimonas sp.]
MPTTLKGSGKFVALMALFIAPLSVAQTQRPLPQNLQPQAAFTDIPNVRADLARIDASLNATDTFSGRFTQYGADGSFAQGQVYVNRPGKLRFEYDEPNPLLIVSDGVTLIQQDRALETFDRVPLSATPLNYFLKENVNLANDTEVIALQKTVQDWRVTARDGSDKIDGTLTMVLDANTLAIKEWSIGDSFGGQTRVILSDLRYNDRLNPRLFVLREDSNRRDNRRR